MIKKEYQKYGTLLSLYLAQSIPMSFFSTVVPVIMRQENYSLEAIGYLQLVKLPWILKFLWAPLVDKSCPNRRKYRRWIIFSELFYAVVIVGVGFLNLQTDFSLIIFFMVIAFVASATQDIATDAFAILSLKKEERSLGNSMQSAGMFLGTLVGSGLLLIIYHYLGWRFLLIALAAFVLIALIPLKLFRLDKKIKSEKSGKAIRMGDILLFFRQPGIGKRVVLLLFFYSGMIGILTMLKPFLVDLGYNVKDIGFISGIFGTAIGALSALLGGLLIRKIGRHKSLYLFATAGLIAAMYFLWLSHAPDGLFRIYGGVAILWGSYAMSSVGVFTISMDIVRPGREGTDFTLQIVLVHLSSLAIAVSSGRIADLIGYKGLFLLEIILAAFVILAVKLFYNEKLKTR
ncbi:MAG: MFS transporter [Bacteroidales bacterium]|nr:MFS transporter [Bacteroidales bacterium]MCF8344313.1 MFS transporter [Bacteroidales bacterium]MCF8377285.1 MFS transporter [Bacteroidales bacterium]MCF8401411.1 MFS transporter [Bacteroidales bacterium]